MFDEKLFIDGVDNEWCWRAATKGYRFYIAENARIRHMLGKESRKIGNKDISISSEFRIYYQFRNYIWLSGETMSRSGGNSDISSNTLSKPFTSLYS